MSTGITIAGAVCELLGLFLVFNEIAIGIQADARAHPQEGLAAAVYREGAEVRLRELAAEGRNFGPLLPPGHEVQDHERVEWLSEQAVELHRAQWEAESRHLVHMVKAFLQIDSIRAVLDSDRQAGRVGRRPSYGRQVVGAALVLAGVLLGLVGSLL